MFLPNISKDNVCLFGKISFGVLWLKKQVFWVLSEKEAFSLVLRAEPQALWWEISLLKNTIFDHPIIHLKKLDTFMIFIISGVVSYIRSKGVWQVENFFRPWTVGQGMNFLLFDHQWTVKWDATSQKLYKSFKKGQIPNVAGQLKVPFLALLGKVVFCAQHI